MNLTESQVTSIVYTDKDGINTSLRTIVPVSVPQSVVRAIDVSELTAEDQQKTADLVAEYKQYVNQYYKEMPKFEAWAEQVKQLHISPKWRSFAISGIKQE